MREIVSKPPRIYRGLVIRLYEDLGDVARWDRAVTTIHKRSGDVVTTPSREILKTLIDSYFESKGSEGKQ